MVPMRSHLLAFLVCSHQVKRQAFPRFFFLADEELLELLSRCRDTSAVQPHLRKCFDAVHSLDFEEGPGSNTINAMVSMIKPIAVV